MSGGAGTFNPLIKGACVAELEATPHRAIADGHTGPTAWAMRNEDLSLDIDLAVLPALSLRPRSRTELCDMTRVPAGAVLRAIKRLPGRRYLISYDPDLRFRFNREEDRQ